jgi:CelD/BcsL family acetyltransferase involved in cellulose biosynthesis
MSTIPEIREFDIGRGDEQFKREWTSLFHEHQRLIIRPKTALWRTAHVVQHYVLPVIKRYE